MIYIYKHLYSYINMYVFEVIFIYVGRGGVCVRVKACFIPGTQWVRMESSAGEGSNYCIWQTSPYEDRKLGEGWGQLQVAKERWITHEADSWYPCGGCHSGRRSRGGCWPLGRSRCSDRDSYCRRLMLKLLRIKKDDFEDHFKHVSYLQFSPFTCTGRLAEWAEP